MQVVKPSSSAASDNTPSSAASDNTPFCAASWPRRLYPGSLQAAVLQQARPQIIFLFALLSLPVYSQSLEDTTKNHDLRPVVITAQYVPTDIRKTVNVVRTIPQKTIARRAAVTLEELLQADPNIRLSQDAILGSSVAINGMQGENVKILIDGVPVTGRLNGSVDAGQIQLSAVQQVEIIEGAQSLMYGSEASAGVINLVTRKSQLTPIEIEGSGQWESSGYRKAFGRAGYRAGHFLLQANGEILQFSPEPDTSAGRDQLWNPKKQKNARAMLRYAPSEKLDMRLTATIFHEQVDNHGELRRPQFRPYAFDDYYYTGRKDITWHAEGRLKNTYYWQSTMGYNRFDRIKNTYRYEFEDESQALVPDQQDTSGATGWLTRLTLASDFQPERINFLLGIENLRETAEGVRIADTAQAEPGRAAGNDLGIFGSLKRTIGASLTLQAGARWTVNTLYGHAVTPSAWMLWQPSDKWQLRLSYANGFRSPGLKELYFRFIDINHFILGNTALRPERSHNVRADLAWLAAATGAFSATATGSAFYNKINDRIILAEFAATQYQYANLDTWQTTGAGLGFSFSWKSVLRWSANLVMTGYYNPLHHSTPETPRYNWSPDFTTELSISFFEQKGHITLWQKLTGSTPYYFNDGDQLIEGRATSWSMMNAGASWQAFPFLRIQGGAKNIFDVKTIRRGAADGVGHSGAGDTAPVHWGRTWYAAVTTLLQPKQVK